MTAVKYSWHDQVKKSGSFLIGSSPEFDMALYTFCYLTRRGGRNTCNVSVNNDRIVFIFQFEIDGCQLSITSYELIQRQMIFIGTIYPSAGRMTDECRRRNT